MMIPLCLATGAKWSEAENLRGSQISAGMVTFIKTKHKCNRTIPLDVDLIFELSKKSALLRFQEYS
ncbi:phage integrase [Klebsiella variicola]|nr:phage integrase [Klebsiella variicola]SLW57852.1 phage integrase [Klebsiella variicola]SMA08153.1 phage integrase [Klebsiella variicola]SMA10097.1 phage integrase [Klebsiella variicola]SMA19729.1 phage integrase [Klebsiella variicola]